MMLLEMVLYAPLLVDVLMVILDELLARAIYAPPDVEPDDKDENSITPLEMVL